MAVLPKKVAKAAAEVESSSFDALPPGPYIGQLVDVKTDNEGPSGAYWRWEFDVVAPEEFENRKLWVNTSLSDKAVWKLKEVFDAFGHTTDSDTDDLIGQRVKLIVSQQPIEKGNRAGQMGNNVDRLLELTGDEADGELAANEF